MIFNFNDERMIIGDRLEFIFFNEMVFTKIWFKQDNEHRQSNNWVVTHFPEHIKDDSKSRKYALLPIVS